MNSDHPPFLPPAAGEEPTVALVDMAYRLGLHAAQGDSSAAYGHLARVEAAAAARDAKLELIYEGTDDVIELLSAARCRLDELEPLADLVDCYRIWPDAPPAGGVSGSLGS